MTLKVCLDRSTIPIPSEIHGPWTGWFVQTGHLFKIKHYKIQLQSAQFEQL